MDKKKKKKFENLSWVYDKTRKIHSELKSMGKQMKCKSGNPTSFDCYYREYMKELKPIVDSGEYKNYPTKTLFICNPPRYRADGGYIPYYRFNQTPIQVEVFIFGKHFIHNGMCGHLVTNNNELNKSFKYIFHYDDWSKWGIFEDEMECIEYYKYHLKKSEKLLKKVHNEFFDNIEDIKKQLRPSRVKKIDLILD